MNWERVIQSAEDTAEGSFLMPVSYSELMVLFAAVAQAEESGEWSDQGKQRLDGVREKLEEIARLFLFPPSRIVGRHLVDEE